MILITHYILIPILQRKRNCKIEIIIYDRLICTLDKATACVHENIDLLIDDSISNCKAVSAKGIHVVRFTSKWNKNESAPFQKVKSWKEVYKLIHKIKTPASKG